MIDEIKRMIDDKRPNTMKSLTSLLSSYRHKIEPVYHYGYMQGVKVWINGHVLPGNGKFYCIIK